MNLYAVAGSRTRPTVLALALDQEAQTALTTMFARLATAIVQSEHVPFDTDYRAEDGEVVVVPQFELSGPMSILLNGPDTATLPQLNAHHLNDVDVRALAAVEWAGAAPRFIAFQRLETRYVLKREPWRLMLADGRFVRDERPGLEIAERIDALLEGDTLYVTSWSRAHSVLDLTAWMREATVAEMETFFAHKKLALADGFDSASLADTIVRRKIASIAERQVLDKCSVKSLREYAAKFGVEVAVAKGRIVLPSSKKEFKAVLGLLNEDLLSFEPTDGRWLVNSKRRV